MRIQSRRRERKSLFILETSSRDNHLCRFRPFNQQAGFLHKQGSQCRMETGGYQAHRDLVRLIMQ